MTINSKIKKVILFFSFLPISVFAYVPLVSDSPLKNAASNTNLQEFLKQVYDWGVGIAVALAILFIIFGGIEYMTTDSVFKKEEGRKRVVAAVAGLLIVLSSWLILNQINPQIFNNNLNLGTLNGKLDTSPVTVGGTVIDGGGIPTYIPGTPDGTSSGSNFDLAKTDTGYSITPSRVSIDTDGKNPPPFYDPHYQGQTSLSGLDANVDNYVVVPLGSSIPLGTKVVVTNHTTGRTVNAIVGDRGPMMNGYGELSLAAARNLGAWTSGMGNSANQHVITYNVITNP